MKSFLYPLIATAWITVTPFLLSFQKGQDILHGLFLYGVLVLLLLWKWVQDFFNPRFYILKTMLLSLLGLLIFALSCLDVFNILAEQNRSPFAWVFLAFFLTLTAFWLLKPIKALFMWQISLFSMFFLVLHLALSQYYPAQALAEFSLTRALYKMPQKIERDSLSSNFKEKYLVLDTASVTMQFIDTSKLNVMILVESWGIDLDIEEWQNKLRVFQDFNKQVGAHSRAYSRSRTAEREDLLYQITRQDFKKDSIFLPQYFNNLGFHSYYYYAGNAEDHKRDQYIYNLGFSEVHFGGTDSSIYLKIDSLLKTLEASPPALIAFSTTHTKFPLSPQNLSPDLLEKLYTQRLTETLKNIANLAEKHPTVRFILQGDHEPILSPLAFQNKFYKRWVPLVVLH